MLVLGVLVRNRRPHAQMPERKHGKTLEVEGRGGGRTPALHYRSRTVTQRRGMDVQLTSRVKFGTIKISVVANRIRLACRIFGCLNMATCLFFLLVWRHPPLTWLSAIASRPGLKPSRQNPAMAYFSFPLFLLRLP